MKEIWPFYCELAKKDPAAALFAAFGAMWLLVAVLLFCIYAPPEVQVFLGGTVVCAAFLTWLARRSHG